MNISSLADRFEASPQIRNEFIRPRTLGEALDFAESWHSRKFDMRVPATDIHFREDGSIEPLSTKGGFFGDASPFSYGVVSNRALEHMIQLLGIPGLNRRLIGDSAPTDLAADIMNRFIADTAASKTWLPRFVGADNGTAVMRALGSSRFNTRLDNRAILKALMAVRKRDGSPQFPSETLLSGSRYFASYIDRDEMRIQFQYKRGGGIELQDKPNGGKSYHAAGIRFRNGEVKNSLYSMSLVLWGTECDNSIVVPFPAYTRNHSGVYLPEAVVTEALSALIAVATGQQEIDFEWMLEVAAKASMETLTASAAFDVLDDFVTVCSLGDSAKHDLIDMAARYAPTRLGIAGAVADYAHTLDAKKQDELERVAGMYLFDRMPTAAKVKAELVEAEVD